MYLFKMYQGCFSPHCGYMFSPQKPLDYPYILPIRVLSCKISEFWFLVFLIHHCFRQKVESSLLLKRQKGKKWPQSM